MRKYEYDEFRDIPGNPVIVDFTGCKSMFEFHNILQRDLGLPEGYGKNWDALWDMMRDYTDEPLTIEIRGLQTLPSDLIGAVNTMYEIFNRVHQFEPAMTFVQVS